MKNFTMKRVLAGVLCAAGVIASALTTASACTTIYAGANLTQENTRFIARREDYGPDMNKLWFVSEPGAYSVRLEMHPCDKDYLSFMEETGAEYVGRMLQWV